MFFIGLNVDVKTKMSPFACSTACSSLRPTTDSGGMLQSNAVKDLKMKKEKSCYIEISSQQEFNYWKIRVEKVRVRPSSILVSG